jgi:hypothetical protein
VSFNKEALAVGPIAASALPLAVVKKDAGAEGVSVIYEAAIPWKTLGADTAPAPGTLLGFGLTVNNKDDEKQTDPSALGAFDLKDPNKFGWLLLDEGR